MDAIERARRYVAKMEPSISGSGGHNACYAAAVVLVKGFDLGEAVALQILTEEFNTRCAPAWKEKELRHKISQAAKANSEVGYLLGAHNGTRDERSRPMPATAARAAEPVKKGQDADPAAIGRLVMRGHDVTPEFLMERSPIDLRNVDTPELFLGHLYEEGEKALIFTSEYSQGDFGFFAKGGADWPGTSWRLGARPNMKPTAEPIVRSARCGVWFLANPVDGTWKWNGGYDKDKQPILSRRSEPNVTSWRYLLLESDSLDDSTWLNLVAQLPLPIAALYTSGGRSVHALVRMEAKTANEMRQMADMLGPLLAKLGGDWKAMTGVRLTRLPLCLRQGKEKKVDGKTQYTRFTKPQEQRLLWLDPAPVAEPIFSKPRLRTLDGE